MAAAGGVAIVVGAVTLLVYLAGAPGAVGGRRAGHRHGGGSRCVGDPVRAERGDLATILKLIAMIPPAPDTTADAYAFVHVGRAIDPNLYVMRGYRLTTGYLGLYPAVSHPVDNPWAMQLSGTRWIFTRDGSGIHSRAR